jgi:hypothetical protein
MQRLWPTKCALIAVQTAPAVRISLMMVVHSWIAGQRMVNMLVSGGDEICPMAAADLNLVIVPAVGHICTVG